MATTVTTSASHDSFNSKLYSAGAYGVTDWGSFSQAAPTLSAFDEAMLARGDGQFSSPSPTRSDVSSAIYAPRGTPSTSPVSSRHTDSQESLRENTEFVTRVSPESTDEPQQSFSEDAEDDPERHSSGAQPEHAVVGDAYAAFLAEDSSRDTAVLPSEVAVAEGEGEGVAPSLAGVNGAGDVAMQMLASAAELATPASHVEPGLPRYSTFVQQLPADSYQTPTEFTQAPFGPTIEVNSVMPMPSFDSALNDGQLPLDGFDRVLDACMADLDMPSAPFTAMSQAQQYASTQMQQTNFQYAEQYLEPQALSFASDNDMPSGAKRSYTEFDENLVNPTSYPGQPYSAFSHGSAYSVAGRPRKKAIMMDGATSIQPLSPGDQLFITSMTEDDPYEDM